VYGVLLGDTHDLELGRTQRLPNAAQRRALMVRDGGCRFPGCPERRYVEAHHVLHWTKGGRTDMDNLVLLCWRHHHAVHEGGCRLAFEHEQVTVWRPDGTLLHSESLLADGPGIVEQNEALGLDITPETIVPDWDGRRVTPEVLSDAVDGLLLRENPSRLEFVVSRPAATEPPPVDDDRDYPDVFVIDDYDDDVAV
jgi:hypothetical protein